MHLENDLYQGAFLLVRGFPLKGIEPVGSRFVFQFEDEAGQASSAVTEYLRGAEVPAREFSAAIQQLKTALYAQKYSKGRNRNERQYYNYF